MPFQYYQNCFKPNKLFKVKLGRSLGSSIFLCKWPMLYCPLPQTQQNIFLAHMLRRIDEEGRHSERCLPPSILPTEKQRAAMKEALCCVAVGRGKFMLVAELNCGASCKGDRDNFGPTTKHTKTYEPFFSYTITWPLQCPLVKKWLQKYILTEKENVQNITGS